MPVRAERQSSWKQTNDQQPQQQGAVVKTRAIALSIDEKKKRSREQIKFREKPGEGSPKQVQGQSGVARLRRDAGRISKDAACG